MSELIDRQQALDIFDDYNVSVENGELEAYRRDRKRLCELPSVQPERVEGEWIPHKSIFGGLGEKVYTCDKCGYNIGFRRENYCPDCGSYNGGEKSKGDDL